MTSRWNIIHFSCCSCSWRCASFY